MKDMVFTIFAAYQGTAEAAAWILLSYVWDVVGIAAESFGAAASCQVAKILGREDGELAKYVSFQSMKVGTATALVCSALLLIFRKQFVWCFSVDKTIEGMIYELIPYIGICQPFFTLCWTAMELNDALHLFKKSTFGNTFATCLVVIPLGYVMTYNFHFNLEGLASAQCIGYIIGGVISVIFFAGADWDKAVRKAKEIRDVANNEDDSEDDSYTESFEGGYYEEYSWDDLSPYIKDAAITLGFDEEIWDNSKAPRFTDYDKFTRTQLDAAKVMGYTRKMYTTEELGDCDLSITAEVSSLCLDDLSLAEESNYESIRAYQNNE